MWRVIRFVAGAFVLLLAASQSPAQTYSESCETCDIDLGAVGIHLPFCISPNEGDRGNTHCQTRFDASLPPKWYCVFLGDPCLPIPAVHTYQAFWVTQSLFGFMLSGSGSGFGCCEPDGTDWCAAWGMPSGCT